MRHAAFAALGAVVLSAFAAQAEESGQELYQQLCATCHGMSAKGDGPLGGIISVPIPDLTTLQARNDGEFPMLNVIHIVDGRTGLRGHDTPMPVYGMVFKEDNSDAGKFGAEIAARGMVLSIAYYLESIQE